MADKESDLVEIGGLWLNESKGGEKYFSGSLGSARLIIFKNKFKEADNQPDYRLYVAPRKKDND